MTREEIKDYIKPRLLRKYQRQYKSDPAWAWQLIRDAVQNSTAGDKVEIMRAVENVSIIVKAVDAAAEAEADTMLSDDSLNLTELARILGDN